MADRAHTRRWSAIALGGGLLALSAALAAAALLVFGLPEGRSAEPGGPIVAGALDIDGPSGTAGGPSDIAGADAGEPAGQDETRAKLWPGKGHRTAAVRRGARVEIRRTPGGELAQRVGSRTEFKSPQVFSVIERRGNWISIATPVTQDNSPGWVRLDPAKLELGRVSSAIVADLGKQRVELHERGEPVKSFPVTIGAAGSSTPPGRFAVTDTFTEGLSPTYGCCAIALSAHQPNLPPGWLGGDRVAIHGTTGPVGGAKSAGCLRTEDAVVRALMSVVELGTPVEIRA